MDITGEGTVGLITYMRTDSLRLSEEAIAAAKGFINATDCADYLTKKGMPFRDAYKKVGLDIEAGKFTPDKRVHHTHEGSIGNLCNDKIHELMEQVWSGFNFARTREAENRLLGR